METFWEIEQPFWEITQTCNNPNILGNNSNILGNNPNFYFGVCRLDAFLLAHPKRLSDIFVKNETAKCGFSSTFLMSTRDILYCFFDDCRKVSNLYEI